MGPGEDADSKEIEEMHRELANSNTVIYAFDMRIASPGLF